MECSNGVQQQQQQQKQQQQQQPAAPAPPAAVAPGPLNSDPLQASSSSSSLPPSTRSDSTSPYADDESFAMFVAQEANETASALDQDNSSLSPSPTPTPDPTPLPNDLLSSHEPLLSLSGSGLSLVQQFGITSTPHPTPLQPTEETPNAVSL